MAKQADRRGGDKQDGEHMQGRKMRHHRPAKREEVVVGREKEIG